MDTLFIVVTTTLVLLFFLAVIQYKYNLSMNQFGAAALIIIGFGIVGVMYFTPDPVYTGEIVKFYANGTGLLDNGTLINLTDVPGWGCGP